MKRSLSSSNTFDPANMSRTPSRLNLSSLASRFTSSSKDDVLPSTNNHAPSSSSIGSITSSGSAKSDTMSSSNEPMLFGVPLKYVSLLTLAVQNAALSIVMHYSRVSTPASKSYSPAAAVLLNELLKGSISFIIALARTPSASTAGLTPRRPRSWGARFAQLCREVFAPDCVKLSIPAILYVIQNSLQFVAISNLPVASFQVAYQMKIMTTAAFSVALLGKRLSKTKWMALLLLAVGVGIVQIQTTTGNAPAKVHEVVGSAAAAAPKHLHVMFPVKGFAAVIAACFTSGLAGVYFEMVLKNSKADLWVRNVQLSLFSLIPALLPILFSSSPAGTGAGTSHSIFGDVFRNFGGWAWATVGIQVFGGLVTAIVIKYSDNIMKGFATSLSIILSFLASVALFDFHISSSFLLGASTVLAATWMYNQPAPREPGYSPSLSLSSDEKGASHVITSPIDRNDPILGEKPALRHAPPGPSSSQSLSSLFGLSLSAEKERLARERSEEFALLSYASRAPSQSHFSVSPSPFVSRSPSPYVPSPASGLGSGNDSADTQSQRRI